VPRDEATSGLLPTRTCENCGGSLEGKRRHARFCSGACRAEAHQKRQMNEEIRAAQEQGVADVERQLAEGKDPIYIEGRALSREGAWAATAGLRATWEIPNARATARTIFESGQWWVYVQVPLGKFPG
jgi:hypothetical protein